ncbi:GNAT family N-acetyltransferase [Vibrio splendidus]|nr:GNAT family N-acetyltransferase [Vibrio splendidus]MCC4879441.1 GNAT family N-acetyltransferase [Vibrio splendidus]
MPSYKLEVNRTEDYDASIIGLDADDVDCHLTYSIYCDQDRKENSLINSGICPNMAEYPLLLQSSPLAILRSVGVDMDEQGNGYGKELVEVFLADAQRVNAHCALVVDTLQTQKNGLNLIDFYKSLGFTEIRNTKYYDSSQKDTCSLPVMVLAPKDTNGK